MVEDFEDRLTLVFCSRSLGATCSLNVTYGVSRFISRRHRRPGQMAAILRSSPRRNGMDGAAPAKRGLVPSWAASALRHSET